MARSPKDSKHQPRTTPTISAQGLVSRFRTVVKPAAQRSCSGFESRHRNCPAMHGGRRLQTCATGEWARRSCIGLEVVTGTALQHTAVAGYKPALPGNGPNALVVDSKVVTGTALQRTAVAGYKPALPGNGPDERSCRGFESRHRNCPATHGGRRLQTCATGEWPNALVVDLKVVTGIALRRSAVAGYKPALPGNETCEMTCARYSYEH